MTQVENTFTGETRWTAILSSDMAGFTQLSRKLDNEATYALLQDVIGLAHKIIEEHGGTVVDTAGDGILAAFGAPLSLENASAQCCKAAFAFHTALNAGSEGYQARFGVIPQFRTGLAGGSTMIGRDPTGALRAVGDAVNLSARLCAVAQPGAIVLTETLRAEAEGDIKTTPMGPTPIKGYSDPIPLYALDRVPERSSRFESLRERGIVGFRSRALEISQASTALVPATPQDTPKIVLISGVAGVGKSRLTYEILERFVDSHTTFVGQCTSQGTAPALGPVRDILNQSGRTLPQIVDPSGDVHADPFAAALEARQIARRELRDLHHSQNAIIVIEDAHWIDDATSDLIAAIASDPIPMIVTCRTTFDAPWVQSENVVRIDLNPLQSQDIQQIAQDHLKEAISPSLTDLIWKKSEGIPLIAEEIARSMVHNNVLVTTPQGLALHEGDKLHVTGNLEQMVMARVDDLSLSQRTALQVAAAIGREFSQSVLSQVLGQPCDASLIDKMGGLIAPAGPNTWRFSHALVQDAVYGSQLTNQRRTIHLKIAQTLEANRADLGKNTNLLAEHYVKAEVPKKAVQYLLEAARRELSLYALAQVDQSIEQAMTFITADPSVIDPSDLGDLAVIWLRALDQAGNFAKLRAASSRVLPLVSDGPYSPQRSIVKTLTSIALSHTRLYKDAEAIALVTLEEAQTNGDDWGAAWAKVALMRVYDETHWQSHETIETLAAEIAPVAAATRDKHLGMTAQYLLSSLNRSLGRKLRALQIAAELSEFAKTHNDRRARSYALWAQALIYGVEGNPEAALQTIAADRKEAVQGSADAKLFDLIALYSQSFLVPYTQMKPKLDRFDSDVQVLVDYNLIHTNTWIMAISKLMEGRLADGWRTLATLIHDDTASSNRNMFRQALLLRAETQLIICGVIDTKAEAPPTRPSLPRQKPGLADLARYAHIKLTGLKGAAADFHTLIEEDRLKAGTNYARSLIGLGLIAQRRRNYSDASTYLNEGLAAAQKEQLEQLIKRAQRALAQQPA